MHETSETELLRQYLAGRDVPCPHCGYNLCNLNSDRCPECGRELALRVGMARVPQGAFLTGLIGLAMGTGFSGLLVIYFMASQVMYGLVVNEPFLWVALIPALLIEGAALGVWLALARLIRSLPASARWGLAALAWLLTVGNVTAFTLLIR